MENFFAISSSLLVIFIFIGLVLRFYLTTNVSFTQASLKEQWIHFITTDDIASMFFVMGTLLFFISIGVFIIPKIYTNIKIRRIKTALANGGGTVQATVQNSKPTGAEINDIPVMQVQVRFNFEGKRLTRTIKTVGGLGGYGVKAKLIYDPLKDKLYRYEKIYYLILTNHNR